MRIKLLHHQKREITFNSSLVSNDGLLIKHISESSGVSYEQAESFISDVVETWKERLNKKGNHFIRKYWFH
ncbi:hypothetical protein QIU18_11280 [Capnocytophaga canimorsus]|nr:hypothetical protein [Capnocytophaga canimorsus]WGU70092.1 hypothetical protein QIU18_11280 [Capnocytophaga canimorsus]